MNKKYLLVLSFCAWIGFVSAQSLQFEKSGHALANNEVVLVETAPNTFGEMSIELDLRNLTSQAINVMVEKEHVSIVEGTENSICWGSCYNASVFVTPRPVEVAANALSDPGMLSFHYQLDPTYTGENLLTGTTIVKYYAYPFEDPNDRTCIEVHYRYNPENVTETAIQVGKAYPNPAVSQIHFDFKENSYNSTTKAVIYNLLGQEVETKIINGTQGTITFSVGDFQPGIYFCSFFVDDQMIKTEKFIVKK